MTLKQEIAKLTDEVKSLKNSQTKLVEEMRNIRGFMRETQIDIALNMKDLHDRLQYIKTYIGVDEFFEACKKANIDKQYLE